MMMTETMPMAHAHSYLTFVAPGAQEREQRLQFAVRLAASGRTRRDVSGMVFARYSVSRMTAWRITKMAFDLAGSDER